MNEQTIRETEFSLYFWQPWIKAHVIITDQFVRITYPNRIFFLFSQGSNDCVTPIDKISNNRATTYTDASSLILSIFGFVVSFILLWISPLLAIFLLLLSVIKCVSCFTTTWFFERNGIAFSIHCPVYDRSKLLEANNWLNEELFSSSKQK